METGQAVKTVGEEITKLIINGQYSNNLSYLYADEKSGTLH